MTGSAVLPGVGVAVLAGIAWDDLLVVVVAGGGGAGIGLSVTFALLVRGAVQAGAARREGRESAVTAGLALAAVVGSDLPRGRGARVLRAGRRAGGTGRGRQAEPNFRVSVRSVDRDGDRPVPHASNGVSAICRSATREPGSTATTRSAPSGPATSRT